MGSVCARCRYSMNLTSSTQISKSLGEGVEPDVGRVHLDRHGSQMGHVQIGCEEVWGGMKAQVVLVLTGVSEEDVKSPPGGVDLIILVCGKMLRIRPELDEVGTAIVLVIGNVHAGSEAGSVPSGTGNPAKVAEASV